LDLYPREIFQLTLFKMRETSLTISQAELPHIRYTPYIPRCGQSGAKNVDIPHIPHIGFTIFTIAFITRCSHAITVKFQPRDMRKQKLTA